jgi:hypothetical protein
MKKSVTVVEWLYKQIYNEYKISIHDGIMEQAKEMEKQQGYSEEDLKEAFKQAQLCTVKADGVYFKYENFEQYYNETFNKKQVNYDTSFKRWEANALLISKAPEMLEMLVKSLEITNNVIHPKIDHFRNSLRELIKEATEL